MNLEQYVLFTESVPNMLPSTLVLCFGGLTKLRPLELFCANVQLLPHYKAIVAIYFNFKLSQKDKSTNTIYTLDMKDFARFDNNNRA